MAKVLDPYKKMVGERIKARRVDMGFSSQDALADALHKAGAKDVDQSRVSRWETGGALPSHRFRPYLLEVLQSPEDAIFGVEPTAPEPLSAGWQEAARLLDAIGSAGPLRTLIALYVVTSEQKYLDEIRALPNSAPTVQFLQTLPRR